MEPNRDSSLYVGQPVEWVSSVNGERHVGKIVVVDNGTGKALVAPDHPNLRWSAWELHDRITPLNGS